MPQVDRFSVSLDTELLAAFDRHLAARGYENRSEAIRDMIRDLMVKSRLERGDQPVVGILTMVLDHRMGEALTKRFRACLEESADLARGSLQLPVDRHRDALAIALKGPVSQVQAAANKLQALRGAAHGHLSTFPLTE